MWIEQRSQLNIYFNRLARNIEKIKSRAPANEILAMVKAESYGHGAIAITDFLYRNFQIKEFGVASLEEAISLREGLRDQLFDIYIFSDARVDLAKYKEEFLNKRIIPVISSLEGLESVLSDSSLKYLPLVLKFNTGMNRLGIKTSDLNKVINLLKRYGRKEIDHLMSHFACASMRFDSHKLNQNQLDSFKMIKNELAGSGIAVNKSSFSNSGAIEQSIGLDNSHIRPGLMMYGPSSVIHKHRQDPWDGEIISDLKTNILQTYLVKKGDPVGYGATPATSDGLLVFIGLGYGDGILNIFTGLEVGHLGFHGKILGRISMDMTQILFPVNALEKIRPGQGFLLWGSDQSQFLDICKHIKSIPYELFCQIGPRVPRDYRLE